MGNDMKRWLVLTALAGAVFGTGCGVYEEGVPEEDEVLTLDEDLELGEEELALDAARTEAADSEAETAAEAAAAGPIDITVPYGAWFTLPSPGGGAKASVKFEVNSLLGGYGASLALKNAKCAKSSIRAFGNNEGILTRGSLDTANWPGTHTATSAIGPNLQNWSFGVGADIKFCGDNNKCKSFKARVINPGSFKYKKGYCKCRNGAKKECDVDPPSGTHAACKAAVKCACEKCPEGHGSSAGCK